MTQSAIKQQREEPVAPDRPLVRSDDLRVCAECMHAQMFAVQPRAVCTCSSSPSHGKTLFAGQPACDLLVPREDSERVLSIYGLQRMRERIAVGRAQAL